MTAELLAQLRRIGDVDEDGEPSIELLAADEIERLIEKLRAISLYARENEGRDYLGAYISDMADEAVSYGNNP